MSISKHQKFEAVTVDRSVLKNAPYNPCVIDKHSRKKLKDKLGKAGLVETLVWNERTGNLVSGHQRLSILDELEGSKDYQLTVAKVDVDEKTEKELNIFLNNQGAMGTFDVDGLNKLIDESLIDINEIGFDLTELQQITDNPIVSGMLDDSRDMASGDVGKIQDIKDRKKRDLAKAQTKDDTDFYVVVVFKSSAELDVFLEKSNLPTDDRFIDGRNLADQMGIDLTESDSKNDV